MPNLLHLHTSGQTRETYGFGTCRSIPSTFFFPLHKISLPLSSSGKYYRAKSALLSASGESVKTPKSHLLKTNKQTNKTGEEVVWFVFRRGSDSSGGNLGPTVRAALGVCDKACEAFSPSVSSQSSSSTSVRCPTPAVSPGRPPPIGQVRQTTPLRAEALFFFLFFFFFFWCSSHL